MTETTSLQLYENKEVSLADKIALKNAISTELEQVDIPVTNYFVSAIEGTCQGGVYAREVFIPKGSCVAGKVHKYEQLNIMSQGEMWLASDTKVIRVKAPFTVISPPGTFRIAYALEDTVWTTIHGTNEKDLAVIEQQFVIYPDDNLLEQLSQQLSQQLIEEKV